MSTELVHRAARSTSGTPATSNQPIERPPTLPEGNSGMGGLLMLVPMLGAGASMTVMMLFRGSSFAAVGALMMIVTILASVVMVFSQRGKAARARRTQREDYLAYLERVRAELTDAEAAHVADLRRAQPHPRALLPIVLQGSRLWERRRSDSDFMQVRLGVGQVRLRTFQRQGEEPGVREADRFMQAEMERVEDRFSHRGDVPLAVNLRGVGHVSVLGDRSFCDRVASIVVAQAASFAAPYDVFVAVVISPGRESSWSTAAWLPHCIDRNAEIDPIIGPPRWVGRSTAELRWLLGPEIRRRVTSAAQRRRTLSRAHAATEFATLLVIADEHGQRCTQALPDAGDVSAEDLGATVLHLVAQASDEPDEVTTRIRQDPSDPNAAIVEVYQRRDQKPTAVRVVLDELGTAQCAALLRAMAGLRLSADSIAESDGATAWNVGRVLGLHDPSTLDLDRAWAPRSPAAFLRVPIGVDDVGDPVMLDLKESAQSGMGPHGLCVGATGSGKSELLRTLVLALLSTHSPADVAMVLVDYKGGATFAPFADAPHVHGVITNLGDDATLVERVYASVAGEVRRRQQMLKDAGNLSDITAYRKKRHRRLREGGSDSESDSLDPMPHLLVIIDEFGELLTARPDFIELFLSIGRIGRSIGVHLLLSSQRIESGKLRGLDTYLSYRLGLRTLSEAESRTVLDTPDAFALPALPGYGYLKVDTATYTKLRAGYVSGPLDLNETAPVQETRGVEVLSHYRLLKSPATPVTAESAEALSEMGDDDEGPASPTLLDETVKRMATRPTVGHAVWSPPLPNRLSLDQIHRVGVVDTAVGPRIPRSKPLRVPLGVLDDPSQQWQGPWELDLSDSTSHVLIVGGPRSGRSTVLRTIAASLSLTHTPNDAVVYGIDALGSALQSIEGLPCVAGVAGRMEPEVTRRIVEEVHGLLTEREEWFTHLRVDSLTRARSPMGQRSPEAQPANMADVVLLIDGFGPLAEEHDGTTGLMQALVRRGPAYGITIVSTASRWNEVRLNQQTFFGTTIELRLGDSAESGVDRKLAETLKSAGPGRCLLPSKLFAQVALPRIDGMVDEKNNAPALAALVQRVSATTDGRARPVRVLPASLRSTDLDSPPHQGGAIVPLGLDETTFATAALDFDGVDRNLLIIGDGGTGRTGILTHIAATMAEGSNPDSLVIAVVDPRGTMRDVIPDDLLGGYAGSAVMAGRLVEAILPEVEVRATRLADAAASFIAPTPRIMLIVDDYDVLTASGSSPLTPLVPYLSMGREVNLNVVLARRTNGAARGMFESAFASVRESGATGLLLSGDRSEGQLFGSVRPTLLPTGRGQLVRAGHAPRTVQTVHAQAVVRGN